GVPKSGYATAKTPRHNQTDPLLHCGVSIRLLLKSSTLTPAVATRRAICALMSTRPNTTLADSRARDSQITFSVTHGWSAVWRGRPWLAERRIGETSLAVGSSRFWIGWVTRHGDKCARSTCRD